MMTKKCLTLLMAGILCLGVLAGCGSPEKTIEKIETETSVEDRTQEDWLKLADAYTEMGDTANARFTLIQAAGIFPDDQELQQKMQAALLPAPAPDQSGGSYDGAVCLTFPTASYESGDFYVTVNLNEPFQELEEDTCLVDDGLTIQSCPTQEDVQVSLYLPGTHTVRAFLVERDAIQSQVFEQTYTIGGPDLSGFGLSLPSGRYESPVSLSFVGTEGGTVYYTTDDTDPLRVNGDGAYLSGTELTGGSLTLYTGYQTITARCITDSGLVSPLIHGTFEVVEPAPEVEEEPEYDYSFDDEYYGGDAEKPVIYLYPQKKTSVDVKLDFAGQLTCTYPAYQNGWTVTAEPDGTLTDKNGRQYNYLYWEGVSDTAYDLTRGFCVKGSDTAAFLETALEKLGLTAREANEFIIYWLPKMETNPYNLITFQGKDYTDLAKLTISPEPDTLLRVFMVYQPLEEPVNVLPQNLTAPERVGFTAVEWGGTCLE